MKPIVAKEAGLKRPASLARELLELLFGLPPNW